MELQHRGKFLKFKKINKQMELAELSDLNHTHKKQLGNTRMN